MIQAKMTIALEVSQTSQSPATAGSLAYETSDIDHWGGGQGSGQVDANYRAALSLLASGTTTLNVLAAGGLLDAFGNTLDLDELKGLVVKCLTGSISITGVASGLTCFTGVDEGIKLGAGQTFAINFGAAGLAVGAAGSIKISETSTTLPATYEIALVGAE